MSEQPRRDDDLLDINEVAVRTGHSPGTIRKLLVNGYVARHGVHPLYSLGFKAGA